MDRWLFPKPGLRERTDRWWSRCDWSDLGRAGTVWSHTLLGLPVRVSESSSSL